MAKITKREPKKPGEREVVSVRTTNKPQTASAYKWWTAKTEAERANQLISTAVYLKEQSQFKYRQAALWGRMYNNMPLYSVMGGSLTTNSAQAQQLPLDRPTMNVVQSVIDTLTSRITQQRPRPVFLTEGGDYKAQNLAKQLNRFMLGEFHQTDAYAKMEMMFLDAAIFGTGILKIVERHGKVCLDRVLYTELLVDSNDSMFHDPRCMYQVALVDRDVLEQMCPEYKDVIAKAEQAYPDHQSEATRTVADQVMVVEGWHLPSGPDANDGLHMMAVSSGSIGEDRYTRKHFPFTFLRYAKRPMGFWGQPVTERLMGTQIEINKLLATISASINLVGVPRIFVEDGSKVVKAHLNNQIGSIITYRGTKPQYEVAPVMPGEVYAQLQRLVDYAYQQEGISQMAAQARKPEGLNSGAAIRENDDLQSDRFASVSRRYEDIGIELAHQIIDKAREIAERDGSYQTIYPSKNGTQEIDLPASKLIETNPFIIQCYSASALPKDPAGRQQTLVEWLQAGIIDQDQYRDMSEIPDLAAANMLANSARDRITKILDAIVEEGSYTPPDPFLMVQGGAVALKLVQDYYNLYTNNGLEEKKAEMLRTWHQQCLALQQAALPPAPAPGIPGAPQAVPEAPPTSQLLPIRAA